MAVHAFFMFPETGGKTLEEVEDMFMSKIPAWKTRVEYNRVRAIEQGHISADKITAFRHTSTAEGTDNEHSAVPKSGEKAV